MSFHTRRSGLEGIGRGFAGRGKSPIMYSPRARGRPQPYGNTRNSMQQPSQNMPGNFSQQQHQTLSSGSNYSGSQQQQPSSQQQQQQQQPNPQQPPPPQAQSSQQQPVPPPQQSPGTQVKIEDDSATPVATPVGSDSASAGASVSGSDAPATEDQSNADVKMEGGLEVESEPKPKPWLKKKLPGYKKNKKEIRRRQKARLRKILQPKNAIMVLNELNAGIKFTFQERANALTQTFVVNAEVNNKTYTGQGLSKPLAKQNAAEKALKDLLLQRMAGAAMKVTNDPAVETPEPMAVEVNNTSVETTSIDGTSDAGKPDAPDDDIPWGSLASFALYKLLTEWQSQGTHIPITPKGTCSPTLIALNLNSSSNDKDKKPVSKPNVKEESK